MPRFVFLAIALFGSNASGLEDSASRPSLRATPSLLLAKNFAVYEPQPTVENVARGRDGIYEVIENEGERACADVFRRPLKLFARSIVAGICFGCGGLLCSSVGGDIGSTPFWEPGAGMQRFMFGAIGYPLSILMVALSGASAFTGNLALVANALRKGKATMAGASAVLGITYIGCFVGVSLVALVTAAGNMPGLAPATAIAAHKAELSALQTLVRGIGGGWLIACAITFAVSAMKAGGRLIDVALVIWFPISTYVICDFEHCLANFFFFMCGLLGGSTGKAFSAPSIFRNFALSTLGNIIGAGLIAGTLLPMACGPDPLVGEKSSLLETAKPYTD